MNRLESPAFESDEVLSQRIIELQRAGFELYHRCEDWKKALIKIQQLTDDRAILRIIKSTLGE